jgi:transposase
MNSIGDLTRAEKRRLRIWIRRERDAGMRTRLTIILHLSKGRSARQTAAGLEVAPSTVYRVAERFRGWGWAGLADRREDNGSRGVDELFLLELRAAVAATPADYGFARPTWTQELLGEALADRTGVRVSQATMSRLLKRIGARRGRPRPILRCPWPKARQRRHLRSIERLIAGLPKNEVALYADEVDIHLNPKIGYDWQLRGQQKQVLTPGQNAKRYLAGALDVRTGQVRWVTARHKCSGLFIDLLRHLARTYRYARRIHVIVDNYSIHSSHQTTLALAGVPRITLHFLPPYSPEFNPIERVWLDLHAEVTRNHRCPTIDELLVEVEDYLDYRNRTASRGHTKAVA